MLGFFPGWLSLAAEGAGSEDTNLLNRLVEDSFEIGGGFVWRAPQQPRASGLESDFFEQALHGLNADFGAVIALRQPAVAARACDHAQSLRPALQGVEHVLRVGFARAGDFLRYNMKAIPHPLARRPPVFGDAIPAQIDDNIRTKSQPHRFPSRSTSEALI